VHFAYTGLEKMHFAYMVDSLDFENSMAQGSLVDFEKSLDYDNFVECFENFGIVADFENVVPAHSDGFR
jgi:hypothetical protein